jgi:hypothetical protein
MALTSATRRVFDLVNQIQSTGQGLGTGTRIHTVLAQIVGRPDADEREMFDVYADIVRLVDVAIAEVIFLYHVDPEHPESQSEQDQMVAPLRDFQTKLLSANVRVSVSALMMPTELLYAPAVTTARAVRLRDPSAEELANVSAQLDAVLETILASDVAPSLKEVFRESIERMKRALDRYRIFGAEAVVGELTRLMTAIAMRPADEREKEPVIDQALDRIGKAVEIVLKAGPAIVLAIEHGLKLLK